MTILTEEQRKLLNGAGTGTPSPDPDPALLFRTYEQNPPVLNDWTSSQEQAETDLFFRRKLNQETATAQAKTDTNDPPVTTRIENLPPAGVPLTLPTMPTGILVALAVVGILIWWFFLRRR